MFEQAYGPEGEWVRLFRRDPGYRGTRLVRDAGRERVYLTIDWWESRYAYDQFLETCTQAYAEIDRKCEGLTIREVNLGSGET